MDRYTDSFMKTDLSLTMHCYILGKVNIYKIQQLYKKASGAFNKNITLGTGNDFR